jgi:hypothetical protein
MRYALLLLLCTGCNATAAVDHASIIADIAVRYAAIVCRPQPTPTPDTPAEGCVEGCRCNGTGREKTGDGLSEVDCRCAADCECKPKIEPRQQNRRWCRSRARPAPDALSAATARATGWTTQPANDIEWCDETAV